MYNYFKLKILLVSFILLTGCSTLEERWEERASAVSKSQSANSSIICRPADHYMCIGWAGNAD